MKFQVFKIGPSLWRYTNMADVEGECETWQDAQNEASDLAWLGRPVEACS